MKIIKGGVSLAKGFTANALASGIKKSGKLDLGLIVCQVPSVSFSVFTKSSVKAAPLIVSQQKMRYKKVQALIVNSGNANCFTGDFGLLYAKQSTELIAKALKIDPKHVLVASTGIIGKPLPFKKIEVAIPALVDGLNVASGNKVAQSILTTDLTPKEIAVELMIQDKKVTIGACAKGSGMIQPNMATMLGFITTDVAISHPLLKLALKEAVEPSFNSITVDGCMSTNDMVTIMASGLAENRMISSQNSDYRIFADALKFVCLDLAKKIVLDGEGATKFIEVIVLKAKTYKEAKAIGMAVANSNLVKTAAFGNDPNWGRVAAAVGSLGLNISEKDLKIRFSSFAEKHIKIWVELNRGNSSSIVYTSDLTLEYIKINGRYN